MTSNLLQCDVNEGGACSVTSLKSNRSGDEKEDGVKSYDTASTKSTTAGFKDDTSQSETRPKNASWHEKCTDNTKASKGNEIIPPNQRDDCHTDGRVHHKCVTMDSEASNGCKKGGKRLPMPPTNSSEDRDWNKEATEPRQMKSSAEAGDSKGGGKPRQKPRPHSSGTDSESPRGQDRRTRGERPEEQPGDAAADDVQRMVLEARKQAQKNRVFDDLLRALGVPLAERVHLNTDLKPTQTLDDTWLHEANFFNARVNEDYPSSESGKWMTFHHIDELDDAWERAKYLYRSGQLPEVTAMKVATGAFNPCYAHKPQDTKVICFYCGPASDKRKMLRIGRRVAELMDYQAKHISYKTDDQTRAGITGCIYKIYRR